MSAGSANAGPGRGLYKVWGKPAAGDLVGFEIFCLSFFLFLRSEASIMLSIDRVVLGLLAGLQLSGLVVAQSSDSTTSSTVSSTPTVTSIAAPSGNLTVLECEYGSLSNFHKVLS